MPYLQRYMWKSKEPSNVRKDGDIVDNYDQSIWIDQTDSTFLFSLLVYGPLLLSSIYFDLVTNIKWFGNSAGENYEL